MAVDKWANRRRLLRARERLSDKSFAKMWNAIVDEDSTGQILSAWIAKEELRTLLATVGAGGDAHLTRHRLHRFLAWCIDSQIPELLALARTIDAWQAPIIAALQTGLTNARSEGYNRIVKHVLAVAEYADDAVAFDADVILGVDLHRDGLVCLVTWWSSW